MATKVHRIEITLSDERLRALDEARGNEPRAAFIKRATDYLIDNTIRISKEPIPKDLERAARHVRERGWVDGDVPDLSQVPVFKNVPVPHSVIGPKPAAARKPRPKGKR